MMLTHDPEEVVAAARADPRVLVLVGELALVYRIQVAEQALSQHLGPDWPKLYAQRRAESSIIVPPP